MKKGYFGRYFQSIFACIAYKGVTLVISYAIFINVRESGKSHDTLFISIYKTSADSMKIIFLQQKIFLDVVSSIKRGLADAFQTAVHTTKSVQGIHGPDFFLP